MPDRVKEKLVELLMDSETESIPNQDGFYVCHLDRVKAEKYADHLIANGVTVQSGIDANTFRLMRECERLKEEKESLANAVNVLEEINSDLYKKFKGVTVQEWISVKDRYPDEAGFYIGFFEARPGHWRVSTLHWNGTNWNNIGGYVPTSVRTTHWMPLPQPPKGE